MRESMHECAHETFEAAVDVHRITNDAGEVYRYSADVRIRCAHCRIPMRFIGLPAGLDTNGAATSADAEEARLTIAPKGEVVSVVEGAPMGFSIKRVC